MAVAFAVHAVGGLVGGGYLHDALAYLVYRCFDSFGSG
jgi:hypothetical protein